MRNISIKQLLRETFVDDKKFKEFAQTRDKGAEKIANSEFPDYYDRLDKMEK